MALVTRWYVEYDTEDNGVPTGCWQTDSVHDRFDDANEAATSLVAHGKSKAGVRVVSGFAFDDSHEIEPAETADAQAADAQAA